MLLGNIAQYFFGITIFVTSVFLVLLVLVQRGRGGGLTGALGGPGGQSAFGTKAGDLFTRITVVVAAIWIFLCASAVFVLNPAQSNAFNLDGEEEPSSMESGDLGSMSGENGNKPATPGDANSNSTPAANTPATNTPAANMPAVNAPAGGSAASGTPSVPAAPATNSSSPASSTEAPKSSSSKTDPSPSDAAGSSASGASSAPK